jgi:hypothetical protein
MGLEGIVSKRIGLPLRKGGVEKRVKSRPH